MPSISKKFPLIKLSGTHREIGFQHGSKLKDRIRKTVLWYRKIFSKPQSDILQLARQFKTKIYNFNPVYCEEIEAIAVGAEIEPLWIYMLNARSEIMNRFRNECTAVFFKKTGILAQNWDWAQELENLAIIMQIEISNGTKILMMTEPGIIGKIGFNSHKIGVCLNFLQNGQNGQNLDGVPVHIILRSIMESKSITEAIQTISKVKNGKSANILISDSDGNFIDIEFAGTDVYYPTITTSDSIFIHTNHYLGKKINTDPEKFASSFSRYNRSQKIKEINPGESVDDAKAFLLDNANNKLPICRSYIPDTEIGNAGTVCSVIMDLKNLHFHITKGSPLHHPFEVIQFS